MSLAASREAFLQSGSVEVSATVSACKTRQRLVPCPLADASALLMTMVLILGSTDSTSVWSLPKCHPDYEYPQKDEVFCAPCGDWIYVSAPA